MLSLKDKFKRQCKTHKNTVNLACLTIIRELKFFFFFANCFQHANFEGWGIISNNSSN